MARDATPRRRSARLSRSSRPNASPRKTPLSNLQLCSVVERDETPESGGQSSIDDVISTPNAQEKVQQQLAQLSKLKTPNTEPCPAKEQMHPETSHQTTAKAPDSGLKLGFADISKSQQSLESLHNTPTRPQRQSMAKTNISPSFQFQFSSGTKLSTEGQKILESIREDAAKIKAKMQAEKSQQGRTDSDADKEGRSDSPRKIAKAKGNVGRFSDVHMEQFKKMDSIANHPSAFRAQPSFTQPTSKSLKRTSSKANLDEVERPRTAGKGTPKPKVPQILGKSNSVSPFKSIRSVSPCENEAPSKRIRYAQEQDVSAARTNLLPRPVSSSLMSPTKSSVARSASSKIPVSPAKSSNLTRSNSGISVKYNQHSSSGATVRSNFVSPVKSSQTFDMSKPLPALPHEAQFVPQSQHLVHSRFAISPQAEKNTGTSRLPTLTGLKSILRTGRKSSTPKSSTAIAKYNKTAVQNELSPKKVDFTPSVKSRYAVKLAATSPSPAKVDRNKGPSEFTGLYDPSAYVLENDGDNELVDEESDVVYPTLPVDDGPKVHTFAQKAKELGRRESKEFKSIFTTLHPNPESSHSSLTAVNTTVNKTNPASHVNKIVQTTQGRSGKPSPSTIRHIRPSGIIPIAICEEKLRTVPHGSSSKKRRLDSTISNSHEPQEDMKENRRSSGMPTVPGAWEESVLEEQDEGERRAGKRARIDTIGEQKQVPHSAKKSSTAREAAARSAKDRKSKSPGGVLSLSRLNMLARPKQRD